MYYLLVKVSFAYLLPVSLKSLCFSVLSTKKTILFIAIVFLVIFIQWPMKIMSHDWVNSVSYCSIYIKSLPLEKLLKLQLSPLHKFKFPELKWFVGLMTN